MESKHESHVALGVAAHDLKLEISEGLTLSHRACARRVRVHNFARVLCCAVCVVVYAVVCAVMRVCVRVCVRARIITYAVYMLRRRLYIGPVLHPPIFVLPRHLAPVRLRIIYNNNLRLAKGSCSTNVRAVRTCRRAVCARVRA